MTSKPVKTLMEGTSRRSLRCRCSCNYSYYMKASELKVARIGNSRGIRIPAKTLARYHIGDSVIMEERPEGILLRTHGSSVSKLSWEDTATAMAAAREDWSEWDTTSADGLSDLEWAEAPVRRVAEPRRTHAAESGRRKAPKGK
ncbi:hypothetical protein BH11GEM2_BH11GEM2_04820 [soil metagenome]